MTDIKPGDRIRFKNQHRSDVVRTVTAVGEENLLYRPNYTTGDGEEHAVAIEDVRKVEPWFEVGKWYRRSGSVSRECISIGEHDGARWAVFAPRSDTGPVGFWGLATMDEFEEVTA